MGGSTKQFIIKEGMSKGGEDHSLLIGYYLVGWNMCTEIKGRDQFKENIVNVMYFLAVNCNTSAV